MKFEWEKETGGGIGLLGDAQWVGMEFDCGAVRPCPHLRCGFQVSGEIERAVLHWTALGLAEVHLNGVRLGDEVLVPGWSDFRYRTQVLSVPVAEKLREGRNVLGAVLGDGWYCGSLLWKSERDHYGTEPRFLAALEIVYRGGGGKVVVTDGDWEVATGPILESDLYHGEFHDARRERSGWCDVESGEAGADDWRPAAVFPAYDGILQPKRCAPIRCTETLGPVSVAARPGGTAIFDFGQNMVGVCQLRCEAPAGTRVVLRFAEMLNGDGSLYRENLRTARATDTFVCKGGGEEVWTPKFTFHGFRYVEVEGLGPDLPAGTLTGQVWHSDLSPTGRFCCSSADLNRLSENIRWGMRGNFLDVPTDCPQRDERLGWTGDAQVFIGTAAFHYDVSRFFEKWMFDLVDGQRDDGAFPDVAPDVLSKHVPGTHGNAAWGDAGVICPWKVYWHYGNSRILEENYDAMKAWIDFQESTSTDYRRPPTTYGDWLAIDAVTPQHAPVPSDLVGTAYFAHTTGLMARIAEVLERPDDAVGFRELHGKIVRAFQDEYVTPSGRVVGDCQTGYLLALAFDLLPEAMRSTAVSHLVRLIEVRDNHLSTGFVGTPLLCPVLSRYGRTDLAYQLVFQDTYPSWLYTVRNGATTMWERWNSFTKEKGFGPVEMNSFNHYAYGAVGEWMIETIGGLRCQAPGYTDVLIAPEPGGGVEWSDCSLETPQGALCCHWRMGDESLKVEVEIPEGCEAAFQPPGKAGAPKPCVGEKLLPGSHTIEVDR